MSHERDEMTPMQRILAYLTEEGLRNKLDASKAPGVDVDRYTQLALAAIGRSSKLQTCSLQSLAQSLLESISLGLPISSTIGYACIVPYKGTAAFQAMYLGKLRLAYNEGGATTAAAEVVRVGDFFEHELGDAPRVRHQKKANAEAPISHAYGVIHVKQGPPFVSVWTESELQQHAEMYVNKYQRESGDCLYCKDFPAWCKKTALSRAIKLMPMRSEMARQVMQRDEAMAADMDIAGQPTLVNGAAQVPSTLKAIAAATPMPDPEVVVAEERAKAAEQAALFSEIPF